MPSFNVLGQSLEDEITIFDFERGAIKEFNGYYILNGDEFILYNNAKVIEINYTIDNIPIIEEKTISKFIQIEVINQARLIIKNNSGVVIFDAIILERSFSNIWNYGLGKYFNNDLIIAPISVAFGILAAGTQLLYHFKRVK